LNSPLQLGGDCGARDHQIEWGGASSLSRLIARQHVRLLRKFEDTTLPVVTAFSKDCAIPAILGGDR
jgi:hypothetical protein